MLINDFIDLLFYVNKFVDKVIEFSTIFTFIVDCVSFMSFGC